MDLSDILDGPELGEADQSHGSGAEGDHQIVTDAATIALDAAMAAARPPSRGPGLTNSPASAAQSPSGRRGDGGSRRGPGSATVGGSHPADEDPAFYEHIVQRTNDLFVKLNITTRPIQAFEELQKSASSMFVAIFETLFNVRLKNVIRKPRVVTDYITNANLVMTALSESLPIDLSFLSGEDIYRGDPVQIHHMLSVFESLWAQLYGPASAELKASASESEGLQSSFHAETDGKSGASAGPMSGVTASGGHLGPGSPRFAHASAAGSSPSRAFARSTTPFPGAPSAPFFNYGGQGGDTGENAGVASRKQRSSTAKKTKRRAPRTAASSLKAAATQHAGAATTKTRGKKTQSKTKTRKALQSRDETRKISQGRRFGTGSGRDSTQAPKRSHLSATSATDKAHAPTRRGTGGNARFLDEEDHRHVQAKVRARKRREGHLAPTPGAESLHAAAEKMHHAVIDPGSFVQVRGEADVAGLKVLAERYPSIYRSVWAKQRAASAQRRQMSRKADASVATKRLENDLDRYRKAYEILVKTHEAEVRKASLRAKRAAKLATQAGKLDARVERARSARLGEELENKEQSRALRQQNKEEVLVRSLFSKALKVEKEYLLAMNEQEAEEQAILDKERLDRFASIENYYLDREEMLRERMTKENRDNNIADQARRIALKQLENNLRDEYQAKLDRMSEKWEQHKEHDLLRSEEHLSQVFEDINDQLVRSVRLATATR